MAGYRMDGDGFADRAEEAAEECRQLAASLSDVYEDIVGVAREFERIAGDAGELDPYEAEARLVPVETAVGLDAVSLEIAVTDLGRIRDVFAELHRLSHVPVDE